MNFSTKNQKRVFNKRYNNSNFIKYALVIISFCFTYNVNAQIFKKLAKKAEQAAERTLEKKVEQKAEKETNKAFDSTFNNSSNKKKSKTPRQPISSSKTPESTYRFTHKYVLQVGNGKRKNEIIYYLNSHGDYTASSIPDSRGANMINVMDIRNKSMFMFMDNNGVKQLMAMNMDFGKITNEAIEETEYSIKPTGNTKTILGYLAKEYKTKGKDMHGTVWVTEQLDLVLFKAFAIEKSKKGIDKSWMKNMNGLLLEMNITDTSKRKPKTITMKCITLEKHNLTIDSSQYKKML
ncbi:DUF4412 domain-containing protein [uncultured Lacinutrix sp.]|uniref:DUF4412 domain-containing protein n=1 Tax=uncultured Lacinutrix sp. TaxID=574032 RepID=UPI002621F144|nr:DUF4412 domain-containing protein [uncultured Lacinutrix sp.]